MKKLLIFLMIFLTIPTVLADITIITDQQVYNLGNKIKASASLMLGSDFEGLFSLIMTCGNYNLPYFLTPVSLEANSRTAINVPELTTKAQMLENCTILGQLVTNENLPVEQGFSNSFSVTSQLVILPVNSKVTALPGGVLHLVGVINEAYGNNVLRALTKVEFGNSSYSTDAIDGKFSLSISLSKNIRSGRHELKLSASDSKDNFGEYSIELEVIPIPSYIKTVLSQYNIAPGTKVDILSSLYDQADNLINTTLILELESQKKSKVFRKNAQSNEKIGYEFGQYAEPGIYVLTSTYKDLSSQSFINVTEVREVKIKYENESVFVENIGNIPFIDELTFFVQTKLKKYAITKKVNIEPGKQLNFDLSREVPSGMYDVLVRIKEGISAFKEQLNQNLSIMQTGESTLAEEVAIPDNRPVYKKLASAFESISGSLVGADGLLTKNPMAAPLILISLVLILVVRYGRKPLMKLIKRKKEPEEKKQD